MISPSEYPGAPRWVKALALVALIALVVVVAVHLSSGGLAHLLDHGAAEHSSRTP